MLPQSFPPPQDPPPNKPPNPPPLPPQQHNKRIIKIKLPPSHAPPPQFVAAKSLITFPPKIYYIVSYVRRLDCFPLFVKNNRKVLKLRLIRWKVGHESTQLNMM